MNRVGKDIERLISRHLDGELTEADELELNRELIRNPEAHRLMEEYRRTDDLAGAALSQAMGEKGTTLDPSSLPDRHRTRAVAGHRSWRWLIPGAIAAALAALLIPRPELGRVDRPVATNDTLMISPSTAVQPWAGQRDEMFRNVNLPITRRHTGRDIFGVVGDDGNIYWIEVERTRTIRRPRRRSVTWETQGM